jgi:hypothetical protein
MYVYDAHSQRLHRLCLRREEWRTVACKTNTTAKGQEAKANPLSLPPRPSAGFGTAMVAFEGALWVFGGDTKRTGGVYRCVLEDNGRAGAWEAVEGAGGNCPSARNCHGGVLVAQHQFIVFGDHEGGSMKDFQMFDLRTLTW